MWLSGLVILVNAIGAVFLFLWGPFFFSSTQSIIFGGFSALQAALAGIAFFGFCGVSKHKNDVPPTTTLVRFGSTETLMTNTCLFLPR